MALLLVTLIIVAGCKKKSEVPSVIVTIPIIVTGNFSNLLLNTVDFTGNVTTDGGSTVTKRGFAWSNTNQNPTLDNDTLVSGNGTGSFYSTIKGLKGQTKYYIRAYATNQIGTGYGNTLNVQTIDTTMTDFDNNRYHIVQVGNQVWMAENLKVTHYRNGDIIPEISDGTQWSNLTTGAYCWFNNDQNTYKTLYGALYNWFAVSDARNISPAGWHIPSDAEWTILTTYLGGESEAGGKMKSVGTIEAGSGLWFSPNSSATNETGFSALPGGDRWHDGTIHDLGYYGYWWSATEYDLLDAWPRSLDSVNGWISRVNSYKTSGFSIRCLRD